MTLVITEISKFGIAMVADSAATFTEVLPSGNAVHRVLNGVQKLQVIPYLSAGISAWGLGSIPTVNEEVSTDIWLGDFIERHAHVSSLDEFANTLVEEIQNTVGAMQEPLGFHLAGYVETESQRLPTFYHVRNVDGTYEHYQHHGFITGQDFPPQEIGDRIYTTRNGDYGPYAALAESVQLALPRIQAGMGLTIPYPSLRGRIVYLTAWVRFVSELYASSGLLRTIGGSITAMGIYPDGRVVYSPVT